MSCLFCNIVEKKTPSEILYEDEHALAFKDIRPVAPTHVLVIPKKHIAGIRDLTAEDTQTIGSVFVAARKVAAQLGLVANGFRLVVNDGPDACQTVHHIHVHVIGGRQMTWPPG
jgi:histidine triad (HIT) family protein